ncbi:MFS monocarboxylate transporter-like protein [Hortaea werneckii]|nr:MFS monocarboxylate transporter-like protein [Hortaea werneckii]
MGKESHAREEEYEETSWQMDGQHDHANVWPTTGDDDMIEHANEEDHVNPINHMAHDPEKSHPRSRSRSHSRPTSLARTLSRHRSASTHHHHHHLTTTDPGPPPDGGRLAWTQAAMLHLTIFSTFGFTTSFGSFQTYYEGTLNLDSSTISWLGSLQIFLLFFIGTFSGRAVDAGLFRPVYIAGSAMQLLGAFTTSVSTKYWQLVLSQGICLGIANGLHFCPAMSLASTYFFKKRSLVLGIGALGSCTGGVVFPILAQQLIPRIGFPWTVRIIGFIMLATNAVTIAFYRTRLPPRRSGPIVELSAFREPIYVLYCVAAFMFFWGLYFAFFYVGSYARDRLDMSYQDSVNLLLTMVCVGFVWRLLPNWLADRFGALNVILPFTFVCSVMMYGWIGVNSQSTLYVFAAIYGCGSAGIQSMFPATLASLTTDLSKAGVRMGMGFSIVSFACLTGPPLAGALINQRDGDYLYAQISIGRGVPMTGLSTLGPNNKAAATDAVPLENYPQPVAPATTRDLDDAPPDGGYGWVCCGAIGLLNAFTWGLAASYGVYLSHYLADDYFPGATPLDYALIGGLEFGAALFISPACTVLTRDLGRNAVMFAGCTMLSGGFIAASFATQIWHLYLSQGVLIGMGIGAIFIPSVQVLPQWFLKRRSLAGGLASAGSGFGGLAFSLGTNAMIEQISLAWSLRITGIIGFVANFIGMVLVKDRNHVVKPPQLGFATHLLRRYDCLLLLSWAFVNLLGYMVILYSLSSYAVQVVGLTQAQAGVITAVLNLGTGIGRPLIGLASDRFGRIEVAATLTLTCGLLLVAIWIPANNYGVLIFYAIPSGAMLGVFWMTIGPLCAEVAGLREVPSFLSLQWLTAVLPTTFSEVIALYLRKPEKGRWAYLYAQIFAALAYIVASVFLFELLRLKRRGRLMSQMPEIAEVPR